MNRGRTRTAAAMARGVALTAMFALALGAREAGAFTSVGGRWDYSALPIPYTTNLASAPPSIGMAGAQTAIESGWATWSAPACTSFRTRNAGSSALTRARPGDRENTVLWISGTWPSELGDSRSVIGVTTPLINRATMRIFEADIQYNNVGFRWGTTGTAGTVDTQSIATHEEGHFLGLGHTPIGAAIMFASYGGGMRRTLNADDQNGVCTLYPSGAAIDAGTPPMGTTPLGGTCGMGFAPCEAGASCRCAGTDCICTRPCTTAMPCPMSFMCVRTSASESLCLMPGAGTPGTLCSNGLDCQSFLCLPSMTGGAYCTTRCMDDCGCPSGFACAAFGASLFCQRGENTCMAADAGPPADSGMVVMPPADAGEPADMGVAPVPDAARIADGGAADADGGGGGGRRAGCGCAVPGAPGGRGRWLVVGVLAVALGIARRRRQRR